MGSLEVLQLCLSPSSPLTHPPRPPPHLWFFYRRASFIGSLAGEESRQGSSLILVTLVSQSSPTLRARPTVGRENERSSLLATPVSCGRTLGHLFAQHDLPCIDAAYYCNHGCAEMSVSLMRSSGFFWSIFLIKSHMPGFPSSVVSDAGRSSAPCRMASDELKGLFLKAIV